MSTEDEPGVDSPGRMDGQAAQRLSTDEQPAEHIRGREEAPVNGRTPRGAPAGSVAIVGCGPGRRSLVTPEAQQAVMNAGILIGSRRVLDLFPEFKGNRIVLRGNYAEVLDLLERGHRTAAFAVLVSGDPGFHSFASSVVERLGPSRCRTYPGISCVQYAFSRLGLPWEDALLLSMHGGRVRGMKRLIRTSTKACILTGTGGVGEVLSRLPARAFARRRLLVLENLALPGERVSELTRREALARKFSPLAVVVLVRRKKTGSSAGERRRHNG
ncbi:MAG: precorrin-6y C5,15-methyltransferase (decarboxylating) subunit CbiE [Spirochaetota bacterium]